MTNPKTSPVAESVVEQRKLSDHEQMQDAQSRCVPCKLCGGHALISDAGEGAGYYVACSNSQSFKEANGCLISLRRLGGWAYNVMEWWNRLHSIEDDTPTDAGEGVAALTALDKKFDQWLHLGPQAQPCYADGIRPWSTGDLKWLSAGVKFALGVVAHPTPTDTSLVGELVEALEDIAEHAQVRIQDGTDLGAAVWRLALEDVVRLARTALSKAKDTPHG